MSHSNTSSDEDVEKGEIEDRDDRAEQDEPHDNDEHDEDDEQDEVNKRKESDAVSEQDEDDEDDVIAKNTGKRVVITEDEDDEEDDNDDDDENSRVKNTSKRVVIAEDEDDEEDDKDNDEENSRNKTTSKRVVIAEDEDDDDDEQVAGEEKDEAEAPDEPGVQDVDDERDDEPDEDEDEDDDDDDDERHAPSNSVVYDFDIMMAKKKEENSRKRRRRGYEIINDNDDMIADIINQMRDAVEVDNEANKSRVAATNKLKLLPFVMNQLKKIDLRDAFLDSDVLSVMTEWLAPLPDKSLPHLNIRESLLKVLIGFNLYDVDRIKGSGIGKAVMYLYKHPKETKENKQRAKQLISSWSRPIFNLDSSFSAISREEREERDKEMQRRATKRNPESSDNDDQPEGRSSSKKPKDDTSTSAVKPGDKGWIPRARVPAPSMRDYVIRPRSKVDGDIGKVSKRPTNMLEKLMKSHQERRRATKQQRAVNMNIDKC